MPILTWQQGFPADFHIWSCFLCIRSLGQSTRQRNLRKCAILVRMLRAMLFLVISNMGYLQSVIQLFLFGIVRLDMILVHVDGLDLIKLNCAHNL